MNGADQLAACLAQGDRWPPFSPEASSSGTGMRGANMKENHLENRSHVSHGIARDLTWILLPGWPT